MPVYPYECPEHGEVDVVGDYDLSSGAKCPTCGATMRRKYTPVHYVVTFTPGWQPAFGKHVDTQRELNNLIAEKGLVRG